MAIFHTRCFRMHFAVSRNQPLVHPYIPQSLLKHLQRNITRTQNHRHILSKINDRRLKTDSHLASVNDHLNRFTKILLYMLCSSRAWSSRSVGTGRSHITTCCLDKFLRDPVTRKPNRHTVQTTRSLLWYKIRLRKNHSQRTRPVLLCQNLRLLRNLSYNRSQLIKLCNMHDQRIIRRSSLRRINFHRSLRIQRIPSKTIHSLRRKCNQTTLFQNISTTPDSFHIKLVRFHGYNFCFHYIPAFFSLR